MNAWLSVWASSGLLPWWRTGQPEAEPRECSQIQLNGKTFHPIVKEKVNVSQSYPTLWDPMDCIIHGILQARILEWVALPFTRDLPNPGIELRSPALQADSLPAESQEHYYDKWLLLLLLFWCSILSTPFLTCSSWKKPSKWKRMRRARTEDGRTGPTLFSVALSQEPHLQRQKGEALSWMWYWTFDLCWNLWFTNQRHMVKCLHLNFPSLRLTVLIHENELGIMWL